MIYAETIQLPAELTREAALQAREWAREQGDGDLDGGLNLSIGFESDDLWDLRDALAELEQRLQSIGIDWTPDRKWLQ